MGHWSESLVDELARQVGGCPDRGVLKEVLGKVGRNLDVLAGRSFNPPRLATTVIEPNGLPFADIPDMQVGSMEPMAGPWAIPDPVNPQVAAVLQVSSLAEPTPKPA